MLDVASEADTDADTEDRYAGASEVSAAGVPPMMLVHPTTPIANAAAPPATNAPTRACRRVRARETVCHPVSTSSDVTAYPASGRDQPTQRAVTHRRSRAR